MKKNKKEYKKFLEVYYKNYQGKLDREGNECDILSKSLKGKVCKQQEENKIDT